MTQTYCSTETQLVTVECGHTVEAGDTVTDISGHICCLDCWNALARAGKAGVSNHNPYDSHCACDSCKRQALRRTRAIQGKQWRGKAGAIR